MENQPKKKSPAGIILLIILLLLAGTVGYLYYSVVKAPLEPEDPAELAAAAPMPARERFQISAADGTVRVKMDAGDLWSVILKYAGKNFLDTINGEVSSYGLSVSGCGIYIDEEGLGLDLELYYKETRLVAKVPCALEVSGQHLSLAPTGVKLGVIPLPVSGLLSGLKLEYDLALPVISNVTQVAYEEGAILLTGPVEEDIRTLVPLNEIFYQAAVFHASCRSLTDSLQSGEGFAALLKDLEANPGNLEDLYRQLFTLADPEVLELYLDRRYGLTERFFPGIDFAAVEQEQSVLREVLNDSSSSLEQFFTEVVNTYNEKQFQLINGQFVKWGIPFQAVNFAAGRYEALFQQLDPEAFYLILVDAEDGFIRKTSSFYRMADESQQFTREVDFNKTYILGLVFRNVNGEPYLLYETEIREGNTYARGFRLQPLTEEEVSALQVPDTFGVWTGK